MCIYYPAIVCDMERPRLGKLPVSLRRKFTSVELASERWFDENTALGSYWPCTGDPDLQSQIVKFFKTGDSEVQRSCLSAITNVYASMVCDIAAKWKPDAVLRVLGSSETRMCPSRPQTMLSNLISKRLGVKECTDIFFRTEPRNPMRTIERLSGPEMLRSRIDYVLQDLFVVPDNVGKSVIVIDDIYNLGATARVYAAALKRICGVNRVYNINLAATRFQGGRDGWGRLTLDIDRFLAKSRSYLPTNEIQLLADAWVEPNSPDYHLKQDCQMIKGRVHRSVQFLASCNRVPCPVCHDVGSDCRSHRLIDRLRKLIG